MTSIGSGLCRYHALGDDNGVQSGCGTTSNQVVRDNSSAAEERSGEAARWQSLAAVRGGAILLDQVAPELADGYRRYYLHLARQPLTGDIAQRFAATYVIPDAIRVALERQIALILGGI